MTYPQLDPRAPELENNPSEFRWRGLVFNSQRFSERFLYVGRFSGPEAHNGVLIENQIFREFQRFSEIFRDFSLFP